MKFITFCFSLILLISCASNENKIKKDNQKIIKKEDLRTGWENNNVYIVSVIAVTADEAIEKARHKILQDVVKVRMLNESRYTDIRKISNEFDEILKNGKIIKSEKSNGKLNILYKIEADNLKDKFKRK